MIEVDDESLQFVSTVERDGSLGASIWGATSIGGVVESPGGSVAAAHVRLR